MLDWNNAEKVTDSVGYVHTVARLSNGQVGFGFHQKADYWLASVFVGDVIVRADDKKFFDGPPYGTGSEAGIGSESAKVRCENLYADDIAGWLAVDIAQAGFLMLEGGIDG